MEEEKAFVNSIVEAQRAEDDWDKTKRVEIISDLR